MTKSGINEAKKVYQKHHILKDFFEKILDITPEEAGENACKIEHIVSENILDKMIEYTKFYQKNKEQIDRLKKDTL